MELKPFQRQAVRALLDAMELSTRDVVLKSPTGSGKTIILTHFMHQYCAVDPRAVFVWLTPGKGALEEQSREKMARYIPAAPTKLLADVMRDGFARGESCFINWEKLTKKGNAALKEGERTNFIEHIQRARDEGLRFVVIVDESHQNNTVKANEILQYFHTKKIIRCSATPKPSARAKVIEISEEDVIGAGLIKKMLVINEDFPAVIETEDQTAFLLERACNRQRLLRRAFQEMGKAVNPLIIVQLPSRSDALCADVERWFARQGISGENGRLAVWLSNRHENLERIEETDAPQEAVIIKQAVATGWDCPRAYILVKLRENMEETFEIQTIGRIRRMPQARHYGSDDLDSCYLYTLDEKFTAGVKQSLGRGALDACTLFLKKEYKGITLISQQRTSVASSRDPQHALAAIAKAMSARYGLSGDKAANRERLEQAGYLFSEHIVHRVISGETATIDHFDASSFETNAFNEKLSTHRHGRLYHQRVAKMGMEIDLEYAYMNAIVRRLFAADSPWRGKLLALMPREVYAFVINNGDRLSREIAQALSDELAQIRFAPPGVTETEFRIPRSCLFTYDASLKGVTELKKNVYENYLASAQPRTALEQRFEKFCEHEKSVEWVYRNGEKGNEYLSVVYQDGAGRQQLLYPDYVVGVGGAMWIVEAKGGFHRGAVREKEGAAGEKLAVLRAHLDRCGLDGGQLVWDEAEERLCLQKEAGGALHDLSAIWSEP